MKYTCPCCGYKTFSDWPGSYEICPICFWEDDQVQILDPWYRGGANHLSLVEAQVNFQEFGACDEHGKLYVRGIQSSDEKARAWRPVNENDRKVVAIPRDLKDTEWNDLRTWYYWLKGGE